MPHRCITIHWVTATWVVVAEVTGYQKNNNKNWGWGFISYTFNVPADESNGTNRPLARRCQGRTRRVLSGERRCLHAGVCTVPYRSWQEGL